MFSFDLSVGEKLIKVYRQSESRLIKPVIFVMVALYVPIWFLYQYFLLPKLDWLLGLWTLVVLLYAINKYMLWLVTTYLVTDKRVVAVTYHSLFKRESEEMELTNIVSIRQKSGGIFSHLFKYGTLELGGGAMPVKFENITNPGEVGREIKSLIAKSKQQ